MIFCVEDDSSIRELEIYTLRSSGMEAEGFEKASELQKALETQTPELIILDIMLPDMDGIAVLKRLRASSKTSKIPVMMASAKGSEYDKVLGLDSGADDYIAKPFGMMELVSRVKAVLRRSGAKPLDEMSVGNIRVNLTQHKVYVVDEEVTLTRKEFAVLQMLMQSPERVFSRDLLLSEIWGYNFDGETRTIDVHMRTLRQKLGEAGGQLQTVRGVGYRISARREQE
ncbi:MAG: response regulator transcription factor [Clostridia bacterium]|jgi:two-component system, OmpR family, alkaline phosphatase synthesis response regulator PhoP|nr:response regulator transcription factor [Clostridia bacterium]NLS84442.1 response regulator transcription factor [Oscillospiraceae bacterium]